MRLESLQTGQPRTVGQEGSTDPSQRPWTSAIWKEPVTGQVWAGTEGLTGDRCFSTRHHGGPERALLMYPADHYPKWRAEWGRKDITPGAFGENLTVSGLTERTVCVGDVFQIGEARVEVSGPRAPCGNLSRRHGRPDLVQVIRANHRTGWYLRVLRDGWLEAGLELVLLDRPYPQWTIARASDVWRQRHQELEEARLLAACPALLAVWRTRIQGDR